MFRAVSTALRGTIQCVPLFVAMSALTRVPGMNAVCPSGTFAPTLGFSVAMARVPLAVKVGDTVQVDIRGKLLPAQVVKMPFVRNGKILVE